MTTITSTARALAFALAGVLTAGAAHAQVSTWTNPGTGDWFDPLNWTAGVPGAGQHAFVINGGTLQIINAATAAHQTTSLGTNSAGAIGYMEIIDGVLNSTNVFVGHHGYGELTMSGATSQINASLLRLAGNLPTADAVMTINDGTISVIGDFTTAWYGIGHVTQHGGSISCSQVIAGNLSVAESYYDMDGGTLTAGLTTIGQNGLGDFTQSGTSLVDTSTLRIGNGGGVGIYRLQGGTLDANSIYRGTTGSATFEMTGGRLITTNFGQSFNHWDLIVTGGVLAPGNLAVGATQVWGRWAQGNAANYEVHANGLASHDKVTASDGIILSGKITLVLGYAPAIGHTYIVGANDAAFPISGQFFGLPEGATVSSTFAGTTYNFAISYVGGDGNDLVLNACFGDGTGDGVIDFDDMNIVLGNWGLTGPNVPGDLNGSGTVDFDDLNLVLGAWGSSCI